MVHFESKNVLSLLPSPNPGMTLSHWLGQARSVEEHLETLLQRDDLTHPQRAKASELLMKVQSALAKQLERINAPAAKCAPKLGLG